MSVGILIIAVLVTALVGPYFVDWTNYRTTFEREGSRYLGVPVTVAGKAELRILPTPTLSFTDVRIGNEGKAQVSVERFRAELELSSLFSGRFQITQMDVERPTFRFDLADLSQPGAAGPERPPIDLANVGLANVSLTGGRADITDSRTGRRWHAEQVAAQISAQSLQGPGRMRAQFSLEGQPFDVDLGAGALTPAGDLPVKVSVTPASIPVSTLFDGRLRLAAGQVPSFTGTAALSGIKPPADEKHPSPWAALSATANMELDAQSLKLPQIKVNYGPPGRALILEGKATAALGPAARFDASIGTNQIDVDRALGGSVDDPVSVETALDRLVALARAAPLPPVPGTLSLAAKSVVIGGNVMQNVAAEIAPEKGGWRLSRASALLPGNTQASLSGGLLPGEETAFQGHGKLTCDQPAAFAGWWQGNPAAAAGLSPFSVEADLDLRPRIQKLSSIKAGLGEGQVRGAISFRHFPENNQTFVAANLQADRFDIDQGSALLHLVTGRQWRPDGTEMLLDLKTDKLVASGFEASKVAVQATMDANALDISNLSIGDFAGAQINAHGNIHDPLGKPQGRIDASVSAQDLKAAAAFLTTVRPDNPAALRFAALAPALTPAKSDISFEIDDQEALSLNVNGTFAGTRVTLNASGKGSVNEPAAIKGRVDGVIAADDSVTLLRQFGLAPVPVERSGPANVKVSFSGALNSIGALNVQGDLAGIKASFDGTAGAVEGESVQISGRLDASTADIDPALMMAGMAVPDLGAGHSLALHGPLTGKGSALQLRLVSGTLNGADLKGSLAADLSAGQKLTGDISTGTVDLPELVGFFVGVPPRFIDGKWPDGSLSSALPGPVSVDLKVSAAKIDLGSGISGSDAAMNLGYAGGKLDIGQLTASLAGGQLKGMLQSGMNNGEANVTLRASLNGARLGDLVWAQGGKPVGSGTVAGSLDVSSHGRSIAELVSALNGGGTLTLDGAVFPAINPAAFRNTIHAVDAGLAINKDTIGKTFGSTFGNGSIAVPHATGSFSVGSGEIRIPALSFTAQPLTGLATATLDLDSMHLASSWSLKMPTTDKKLGETRPEVVLNFDGPAAAPRRSIDVGPLVSFLNVRALSRQVDEIETLQADIVEKQRLDRLMKLERQQAAQREVEAHPPKPEPAPAAEATPPPAAPDASSASPSAASRPAMPETQPDSRQANPPSQPPQAETAPPPTPEPRPTPRVPAPAAGTRNVEQDSEKLDQILRKSFPLQDSSPLRDLGPSHDPGAASGGPAAGTPPG
nr:AsmA family protein [Faunimonas pinastri]